MNEKVLKKLRIVQEKVPSYMKKEGFNKAFNYSYTSDKQLKAVFQPLFKEAGILFKIDVVDQKVESNSGKMSLTTVNMKSDSFYILFFYLFLPHSYYINFL